MVFKDLDVLDTISVSPSSTLDIGRCVAADAAVVN